MMILPKSEFCLTHTHHTTDCIRMQDCLKIGERKKYEPLKRYRTENSKNGDGLPLYVNMRAIIYRVLRSIEQSLNSTFFS